MSSFIADEEPAASLRAICDRSDPPSSATGALIDHSLRTEIARRRTFAIISHPDAGKTTLTEKLLLYSGQVVEAGAVRGRKTQRAAASDWMAIERERGISITSTVLTFEYEGRQINLLDTPGHDDFSADTYRTLTAADCAVMVIDAVKGIETQTRKLFRICAERRIPILTFVNKMDRPGCDPLRTLSDIEQVLGIHAIPQNWPIGTGREFRGVYDRQQRLALLFQSVAHGAMRVPTQELSLDSDATGDLDDDARRRLSEEIELLDHAGEAFDRDRFLRGEQTPVFFGSALTNFGIEPFLRSFLELAPAPAARMSDQGPIPPDADQFSGVIFKIQANLDPRHHDRVAFLRVCAGRFNRDMQIINTRTGDEIRIKRSQRLFARERETMEVAYPGDVVGLVIPGQFRLGDTLCERGGLRYQGQWEFPPECFATLRCADTSRRKQFDKGLRQLVEEGAIQVLLDARGSLQEPIVAAVGQLQFEVMQYRLESEYNARAAFQPLPYRFARWVDGEPNELAGLRVPSTTRELRDEDGMTVLLFESEGMLNYCMQLNPRLKFHEARPSRGHVPAIS